MKTKLFLIMVAGFAFALPSCNSGDAGTGDTPDRIPYANEPQPDPEEPDDPAGEQDPATFLPWLDFNLTVDDDIISYNTTTGEIVFTDLIVKKLTAPNDEGIYKGLILYRDDKPLLDNVRIFRPVDSNPWYGHVVLMIDSEGDDESFRLVNHIGIWYEGTEITSEMEEDAKKLQAAWDTFIRYLRDTGKIVE